MFTYTYDAVGNRLTQQTLAGTTVYTYDNANRLVNVGAITYTWDANGNLLNDGVMTYTYDTANRLASTSGSGPSSSYAYNGLGDRMRQVTGGITTTYTLDLNAGLTQVLVDSGGNSYLYGNGRIGQHAPGAFTYHLGDGLGSVRQLASATASVTLARSYDPYGSLMTNNGSGVSSFGFTGEWTDNTGLVYLRARYFAPGQGRFISRDVWPGDYNRPLSFNGWAYVEGNPINRVDSSGYTPVERIPSKQEWVEAGGWDATYYPSSLQTVLRYRKHIVAAAQRHSFVPQSIGSANRQQLDLLYALGAFIYQEAHGAEVDKTKLYPDPGTNPGLWYDQFGLPRDKIEDLAYWAANIGLNPTMGICQIRPATTGREIENGGLLYDPGTFTRPNTLPIPYELRKNRPYAADPEWTYRLDRLRDPLWGIEYAAANMDLATTRPGYSESRASWLHSGQNMSSWEKMAGWHAQGHFDNSLYEYAAEGDIKFYQDYTNSTKNAIENLDLLRIGSLLRFDYRNRRR